jgi:hypothetical protein
MEAYSALALGSSSMMKSLCDGRTVNGAQVRVSCIRTQQEPRRTLGRTQQQHPTKSLRWIRSTGDIIKDGTGLSSVFGKRRMISPRSYGSNTLARHLSGDTSRSGSEANPHDPIWKDYFALRRRFRSGREVYFTDPATPIPPQIPARLRVSSRATPDARRNSVRPASVISFVNGTVQF